MEEKRAEVCQGWFKEEFVTPKGWNESYRGYPEPVLGEKVNNWWIASFRHDKYDITVNVEAISEKMGKEAIAWIEGSDVPSQEQVPFTINGGIGASIAGQMNDQSVEEAKEEARYTKSIHPLADRMIEINNQRS